jgi:hypothetical protein
VRFIIASILWKPTRGNSSLGRTAAFSRDFRVFPGRKPTIAR